MSHYMSTQVLASDKYADCTPIVLPWRARYLWLVNSSKLSEVRVSFDGIDDHMALQLATPTQVLKLSGLGATSVSTIWIREETVNPLSSFVVMAAGCG